jgi:hypothetical protein
MYTGLIITRRMRTVIKPHMNKGGIVLHSLLSFVVDNLQTFQTNSDIHNVSTRYRYNLHAANTNLSKYKKGVYYSGIKLFNNLPPTIKSLNQDIKKIKPALKEYLLSHSFYPTEEFTLAKNSHLL